MTKDSYRVAVIETDTRADTSAGDDCPPMRPRRRPSEKGQSLVEFALVLMPLFVIVLAIIQFGFIFNAYVTITNATREGARNGTVYIYDAGLSKAQNDLARNEFIKTSLLASMNLLAKTSPNFATGSTWSQSGDTFTNGDLVVTYALPSGTTDTDARVGYQITVRATYHQDLVVPLIPQLLPKDMNGRLGLTSEVTMVQN
jgi:Flp pilus assembly protein TadG